MRIVNLHRIEERLTELGWSDTRLGQEAKIAQSVISRILSGVTKRPDRETLRKIAHALKLRPGEMIVEQSDPENTRREPTGTRR